MWFCVCGLEKDSQILYVMNILWQSKMRGSQSDHFVAKFFITLVWVGKYTMLIFAVECNISELFDFQQ